MLKAEISLPTYLWCHSVWAKTWCNVLILDKKFKGLNYKYKVLFWYVNCLRLILYGEISRHSLTGKKSSVFLIFTQGTHRNVKNRWVKSSLYIYTFSNRSVFVSLCFQIIPLLIAYSRSKFTANVLHVSRSALIWYSCTGRTGMLKIVEWEVVFSVFMIVFIVSVLKATFHSDFEIPVRPMHEDQMMPTRLMPTEKRVMCGWYTLIFTHQTQRSFKIRWMKVAF